MAEFIDLDEFPEIQERNFRPLLNPLEEYNDLELYKRFRFDSASILYITDLFREELENETDRNRPIPPESQVMIAIRYLACNSYQQVIGDTFGVSQSSANRCIWSVLPKLAAKVPEFVRFPTDVDHVRQIQQGFYNMSHFPGVVACIDGTHINITAPSNDEAAYVNRKRRHSINMQAACDHLGKFTNIVVRWPGSSHDSWVLRQSELWTAFESGQCNGIVLGDSGYPCRPWLLTPYPNPATSSHLVNPKEEITYCMCM